MEIRVSDNGKVVVECQANSTESHAMNYAIVTNPNCKIQNVEALKNCTVDNVDAYVGLGHCNIALFQLVLKLCAFRSGIIPIMIIIRSHKAAPSSQTVGSFGFF